MSVANFSAMLVVGTNDETMKHEVFCVRVAISEEGSTTEHYSCFCFGVVPSLDCTGEAAMQTWLKHPNMYKLHLYSLLSSEFLNHSSSMYQTTSRVEWRLFREMKSQSSTCPCSLMNRSLLC